MGPAIHRDGTLAHTTYLNVADQVHPIMGPVFPYGSDLFQQDNAPSNTANMVREWIEEHKELEVLALTPNCPKLNPIEHM